MVKQVQDLFQHVKKKYLSEVEVWKFVDLEVNVHLTGLLIQKFMTKMEINFV